MQKRPETNTYHPYYGTYVGKVGAGDILSILTQQGQDIPTFFKQVPKDRWEYRYAEGKWTIKEVLLHLIDAERVFAYRALRVGRKDETPLPGFEQNPYVVHSGANERSPESLLKEYESVRQATLQLFSNLPSEAWDQMGTASDAPISPLALAYIIAGHELHHVAIIRERYLG